MEDDTPIGRVGKPGFFTRVGNALALDWSCYFAIEGDEMPLCSLQAVESHCDPWSDPTEDLLLPSDVLLVARDQDFSFQDYGFRDESMFLTVFDYLRSAGHPVEEVTEFPSE